MEKPLTREELFNMPLDLLYELASYHSEELDKIHNELKLRGNF